MDIFKMDNKIQNYAWGSVTAIPRLLGIANRENLPMAELWMGDHHRAPSSLFTAEGKKPLPEVIGEMPDRILGRETAEKYGADLPFLFKVLAAGKPLSIQSHPNRKQAESGFDSEDKRKVPMDAPFRNYKDRNHKPEVICALSPFTALRGFRPIEEILSGFTGIDSAPIKAVLNEFSENRSAEGLRVFFSYLMNLPYKEKEILIRDAVDFCKGGSTETEEWIIRLNNEYPGDIGALAPLFLNLVFLGPGDAMYLGAGELHAYLDGLGIELMANSDNVLRGGLTVKHVDVEELLKTLTFGYGKAEFIRPVIKNSLEIQYPAPAEEFRLSRITVPQGGEYERVRGNSVEIYICVEGEAEFTGGEKLKIRKGESCLISASLTEYSIRGKSVLYRADVPHI